MNGRKMFADACSSVRVRNTGLVVLGLLIAAPGCSTTSFRMPNLAFWQKNNRMNLTARHEDYLTPPAIQYAPTHSSQASGKTPPRSPYTADIPEPPEPAFVGQAESFNSIEYGAAPPQANSSWGTNSSTTVPQGNFNANPGPSPSQSQMPPYQPGGVAFTPNVQQPSSSPGGQFVPGNSGPASGFASQPNQAASPQSNPWENYNGTVQNPPASGSPGATVQPHAAAPIGIEATPQSQQAGFYEYPSTPYPSVTPADGATGPANGTQGDPANGGITPLVPMSAQTTQAAGGATPGSATTPSPNPARLAQLPAQLTQGQGTYAPGSVVAPTPQNPATLQPQPPPAAPSSHLNSGGGFQPF